MSQISPIDQNIFTKELDAGYKAIDHLYKDLLASAEGLSEVEAQKRLAKFGDNEIVHEHRESWIVRLLKTFNNPLILLLAVLMGVSFFMGDNRTVVVILVMIMISVLIKYFQENQAYNAAEKLKAMVKTTCTVLRSGKEKEVDLKDVVPGDVLILNAGDIVPADLRIIHSKELFINQSLLTGEALPVEKHFSVPKAKLASALEMPNLCFAGTNVESGTANAIVLETGNRTYFGTVAKTIVGQRVQTSFDKGVDKFTWLMIYFMAVLVPVVFLINGFSKGNWWEAFMFAMAVAVGLTPEMLPAILTINLTKGSIVMAKKKVIVKRLSSIQNFGAMDVLCTDKTGTLTLNHIVLMENIDIDGKNNEEVLHLTYLNSYFQSGFSNLLDGAVLKRGEKKKIKSIVNGYEKIDELPFDFMRKRLSVVVKDKKKDEKMLICKGAVDEVSKICSHYSLDGKRHALNKHILEKIKESDKALSNRGYRVVAVAIRELKNNHERYTNADEHDMVFLGFMTFFDPPKESAAPAIKRLQELGVKIKVLTGDNELVTKKICEEVKLASEGILLGPEVEKMSEENLKEAVKHTTIFAKLSPNAKKKIVEALQQNKQVVGFLGDGINDAPALRAADVGISVDSAVDIAKESADIILLELNLLVLKDGVEEGRRVFGNIVKYIKMGASSNFGNMFSVLGASIFLPFLPMAPIQLVTNNLLYDLSQAAIPTDTVDQEYIEKPRKWNIADIKRFMIYIGPISSIFDYTTFFIMLFVFNAWHNAPLFQAGWFIESLMTQTLIIHVIRSRKIPFFQTMPSKSLIVATVLVISIAIYLVSSPLAAYFGFAHLPLLYWPLVAITVFIYIVLTQIVKNWYINKFGYN